MNFDLSLVPFSLRGSYLAIGKSGENNDSGLFLRTVRGAARDPVVCRLDVLSGGTPVPYTYKATPSELVLSNEQGAVRICFASDNILLFRGEGEGLGLRLEETRFRYGHEIYHAEKVYHMLVSPPNRCRYLAFAQAGRISVAQDWNGRNGGDVTVDLLEEGGGFRCSLEEVAVEWEPKTHAFEYDACQDQAAQSFEAFCESMPKVPPQYESARELAAYVNWSSMVKASGAFQREAMLMSKNRMAALWSWDHCFNAMALSRGNPDAAWDQFMLPFDRQDATGRVPDCMTDAWESSLYCKPPVHGWALSKMLERMSLSTARLAEAYEKLSRLTNWWLKYRRGCNGLCEYWHGNDSGWDNSTAFSALPPVVTPDLAAFLVIQMDVLADLSARLGLPQDAAAWKTKADAMLAAMVSHCYSNNEPVARRGGTYEPIPNDSLLLYIPVVLGARLPEPLLRRSIQTLKGAKFLTAHGLATESPQSALYQSNGYWRGPIWAPATMLIIDGLARSGEAAFAKELARRFCDMVAKSGCAENFDALTGEGLCDRAYTWTASVFLLLANGYLN